MLHLRDVSFSYSQYPTLSSITFEQSSGEIICLLGPSGCGKTTLLRLIAGLEQGYQGDILIAGKDVRSIPTHKRDLGLMFQDYALFPHLSVEQNVAFGLRMRGMSAIDQQQVVKEMLNLVGLSGYEQRDISSLSGGERQRVALARSLAPHPSLLMLDEPLGSLDAALREHLALEIRRIIRHVRLSALYVTHDQQEAFAIADRVVLMNNGQIVQIGTPQQVYQNPMTVFAAQFLGFENLLPIHQIRDGRAMTALGEFFVTNQASMILLHPDGIRLDPCGGYEGVVTECVFRGDHYKLYLESHGHRLMLRLPSLAELPHQGSGVRFAVERAVPVTER